MKLEARAKINWTLDITGVRDDGYHLMDMLMQSVTLSDTVTLLPASDLSLVSEGSPRLKADERHLALRAARLLKESTGYPGGAAMTVYKRIPVGAGMGGGSADAAAVLFGLNRLWGTGLSASDLESLSLSLGADSVSAAGSPAPGASGRSWNPFPGPAPFRWSSSSPAAGFPRRRFSPPSALNRPLSVRTRTVRPRRWQKAVSPVFGAPSPTSSSRSPSACGRKSAGRSTVSGSTARKPPS